MSILEGCIEWIVGVGCESVAGRDCSAGGSAGMAAALLR